MSGIGAGLGIVNKLMSLFNFDRKSRRRNKIDTFKKKRNKLMAQSYSPDNARRIRTINDKLQLLETQAAND